MAAIVDNTASQVNGNTLMLAEVVGTVTAAWAFSGIANTGLKVLDTDASHALGIVPGSNLTAARTLTLTTGDADRTLTLSANLTVSGDTTLNQSLATSSSPTFNGLTLGDQLVVATTTAPAVSVNSAARGTGAVAGVSLRIGRNTSGNGAAGTLQLLDKNGTLYVLWVDTTGDLRIHTGAPTEDNTTVADTAGTIVGTQS